MKKYQIAVIGSAGQEEYPQDSLNFRQLETLSYELGKLIAEKDCYLITGGKSGIMEFAAKGCNEAGGINLGFVTGKERNTSNQYVDIEIVTNMGDGGDAFLIPYSADGAIVVGGGTGTLKEMTGFYLQGKPIISMKNSGGWADKLGDSYIDERKIVKIISVETPKEAIDELFARLQ